MVMVSTITIQYERRKVMNPTIPPSANDKAREIGFYSYQDYLTRSPHWHMLKRQYSKVPCYCCNEWYGFKLDLHHRSYERLGAELPSDLVKLCKFCHTYGHELIREKEATLENMHEVVKTKLMEQARQQNIPFEAA
jgi:hypothetical protein